MYWNLKELKNPEYYYQPAFDDLLKKTRQYDEENLISVQALPSFGLNGHLKPNESYEEQCIHASIKNFINAIKNNLDPKADLRRKYCRQLFDNADGTCAQHILSYIKKRTIGKC